MIRNLRINAMSRLIMKRIGILAVMLGLTTLFLFPIDLRPVLGRRSL